MSSGQGAMFAVHEERATFGGVEVAKKTVIAATDEGIVQREAVIRQPATLNLPGSTVYNTTEIRTVETVRTVQPIIQQPALPPPPPVVIVPKERTWVDWCFECDSQYDWYNLKGKGICWVLLLILGYLIAGAIVLFFGVAWLVLACLAACSDD